MTAILVAWVMRVHPQMVYHFFWNRRIHHQDRQEDQIQTTRTLPIRTMISQLQIKHFKAKIEQVLPWLVHIWLKNNVNKGDSRSSWTTTSMPTHTQTSCWFKCWTSLKTRIWENSNWIRDSIPILGQLVKSMIMTNTKEKRLINHWWVNILKASMKAASWCRCRVYGLIGMERTSRWIKEIFRMLREVWSSVVWILMVR